MGAKQLIDCNRSAILEVAAKRTNEDFVPEMSLNRHQAVDQPQSSSDVSGNAVAHRPDRFAGQHDRHAMWSGWLAAKTYLPQMRPHLSCIYHAPARLHALSEMQVQSHRQHVRPLLRMWMENPGLVADQVAESRRFPLKWLNRAIVPGRRNDREWTYL